MQPLFSVVSDTGFTSMFDSLFLPFSNFPFFVLVNFLFPCMHFYSSFWLVLFWTAVWGLTNSVFWGFFVSYFVKIQTKSSSDSSAHFWGSYFDGVNGTWQLLNGIDSIIVITIHKLKVTNAGRIHPLGNDTCKSANIQSCSINKSPQFVKI